MEEVDVPDATSGLRDFSRIQSTMVDAPRDLNLSRILAGVTGRKRLPFMDTLPHVLVDLGHLRATLLCRCEDVVRLRGFAVMFNAQVP